MKVQLFLIIVFFQFCSILNVNEENYIIGNFEINQTVSPVTIICNFKGIFRYICKWRKDRFQ